MIWNRRQFLKTSSLAVAAGALARVPGLAQQAAEVATSFVPLRGNIGIFNGRGGTIGWFIANDGIAVVDTQFPDTAAVCLAGIRERATRPIDLLINTHHHGDHTGGNAVFREAVGRIVAHDRVPDLQRAAAAQAETPTDQAYPDTTFADTWSEDLGGERITLTHYGPAHTGGDIVVFFENANVIHMGDLVFNERHPFVDRAAGASIQQWITVLERTIADHDDETLYVLGHAKQGLDVTGSKAHLLVQRDYFAAALEATRAAMAAGRSRDELTQMAELPGFGGYESGGRLTLAGVLGVAYDELSESA